MGKACLQPRFPDEKNRKDTGFREGKSLWRTGGPFKEAEVFGQTKAEEPRNRVVGLATTFQGKGQA